jgi:transcription termination factor Rho
MANESLDRAALDRKGRDELQQIASAVGLTGVSRLKKAELIDRIVASATSGSAAGNGAGGGDGRRTIRSTRSGAPATIEQLAAEEAAIAASDAREPEIRPVRRRPGDLDGGPPPGGVPAARDAATRTDDAAPASPASDGERTGTTAPAGAGDQPRSEEQGRERAEHDDDDSNRRRRRRRGRNRDRDREPEEPVGEPVEVEGLLDLRDEGYGFLRTQGYLPSKHDVYVSASQVRRFGLRKGDYVKGATRGPSNKEKYPALLRVDAVNGMSPEEAQRRVRFEDLTPLFPDERLRLELPDDPSEMTGRIVDLISPIGKGQRGLIVSPPKAGKTTVIKHIVHAIETNNPEVKLIVLLVDERPEEVTDMRRHLQRGEVVASTFDRPSDEHTQVAELTIERAKRLVEMGHDVVIVLDGITRLARAYNLAAPASGRIMSGGVDSSALYPPKRFFGAARNLEEGGSLTIIATALIETGSKMDEVIFEEFKGTGNMELRLDRRLAERRIYPAIDVEASSTRHEELLFDRRSLQQVWKLRRVLNALEDGAGLELLMDKIRTTKTNEEFLAEIAKAPTTGT